MTKRTRQVVVGAILMACVSVADAADVEAILDSTNGTSALVVYDARTNLVARFGSDGESVIEGPLTLTQISPSRVGAVNNGYDKSALTVVGRYAYVAEYSGGLRVYDLSSPTNPIAAGFVDDGGGASHIAVAGNYAYLANLSDGLRVYDVSSPTNPVCVGHVVHSGLAYWLAVNGAYAYLANGGGGLRVYDVSCPTNPVGVGHIDDGGTAYGVAAAGNYVYLANSTDGLRIYDVSCPTNPVNVGHIVDGGDAFSLAVSRGYVYLANDYDGLRIYDVSSPTNPVCVGHISDGGGTAVDASVAGNYLYLANGSDGLRVYDISCPTNPVGVGRVQVSGTVLGVCVSGNRAYFVGRSCGLVACEVNGIAATGGEIGSLRANSVEVLGPVNAANVNTVGGMNVGGSVVAHGGFFGDGSGVDGVWGMRGNTGVVAGTEFLGTTHAVPLEMRVNNVRALVLQPSGANTPNFAAGKDHTISDSCLGCAIGGGRFNSIWTGAVFCVIAGGCSNSIGTNAYGSVIAGGSSNAIGANASGSIIAGGAGCTVASSAFYGFAAGRKASAAHPGSFVWADSLNTSTYSSTTSNQVVFKTSGGMRIVGSPDMASLTLLPNNPGSGVDSQVYLSERSDAGIGMIVRYDGSANELQIFGVGVTGTNGPHLVIARDSTQVGIGRSPTINAFEVEGDASKTTAGDWLANSDKRIKTEVRTIDQALETIDRLRPVKFRYTEEYRTKHPSVEDRDYCNFIAQEYKEVFPESVKDDGSGILQVDAYNVKPYLVRAVQELHEQIKSLKAENDALRLRVEEIEKAR